MTLGKVGVDPILESFDLHALPAQIVAYVLYEKGT